MKEAHAKTLACPFGRRLVVTQVEREVKVEAQLIAGVPANLRPRETVFLSTAAVNRGDQDEPVALCLGSGCMAWKIRSDGPTNGYCALCTHPASSAV